MDALEQLRKKVAACTFCKDLAAERTQTVFAGGNPKSEIVIIGEAPGRDEDRQGIPFVGRAGKMLTNILMACGLTRDDVYIINILKCRPPGNRNPKPEEIFDCWGYLDAQIDIVKPKIIICLGAIAAQNLLGSPDSITVLRGKWHQYHKIKVLCTYHPSYILRAGTKERGQAIKAEVWKDLQLLLHELSTTTTP